MSSGQNLIQANCDDNSETSDEKEDKRPKYENISDDSDTESVVPPPVNSNVVQLGTEPPQRSPLNLTRRQKLAAVKIQLSQTNLFYLRY